MLRTLLLLLCSTAALAAEVVPQPFRAEFAVYRGSMRVATSTFHLGRAPEGVWRWESETRAAGLVALLRADVIIETSMFRLHPEGLEVLQYGYVHRGSDKDRDQSLAFDWATRTARGTVRGKALDMVVPPGTLDRNAMQLAAGLDLAAGRLPAAYTVLDRRTLKRFVPQDAGVRVLSTPLGRLETRLLERRSDDGSKLTSVWYAPSLGWAPVRLEQRDDDDPVISMELLTYETRD